MDEKIEKWFTILEKNNIPDEIIPSLLVGSDYFEKESGVLRNSYWNNSKFSMRDEFFVVLNAYFALCGAIQNRIPNNTEWRLKFDVAYLFQIKSNAQSCKSINELVFNHCYNDALVICRTMLSRLNILILFSLNPYLWNEWAKNPKDERFLDGHIRTELENSGIKTVSHLYELTSEIVHSQAEALLDIGYLTNGLFPDIPAVEDKVYIIAKFAIGTAYGTMIKMAEIDLNYSNYPEELVNHRKMFDWLKNTYLLGNRLEHLFTFIAEDRHWKKVGKDKYDIGGTYDFNEIEVQLEKFHKLKGQKKKLSKKYYTKNSC